jgi:hypothetical protein
MSVFDELPRKKLIELMTNFAKNWLAHDGLWFQAVERRRGMDEAIEADTEAWERFSPIEAARIKRLLGLSERPGLDGLEQALEYRLYAVLNRQSSVREGDRLKFYMNECRVQSARQRKGLPDFPCRPVGMVEYTRFAEAIDPRIRTRCIACPPDEHPDEYYCGWEFWVED